MSTAAEPRAFAPLPLASALEQPDSGLADLRRFERVATAIEMAVDGLTVTLGAVAAWYARGGLHLGWHARNGADLVWLAGFGFGVFFVLLLDCDGAYRTSNSLLRVRETERVLRVSFVSFGLILPAALLAGATVSRQAYLLAIAIVPPLLIAQKQLYYAAIRCLHGRGYGVHKVAIYGAGYLGRRVFSALARSPKLGLLPVALVDDDPERVGQNVYELDYRRRNWLRVAAGPISVAWMRRQQADVAIIAIPHFGTEKLAAMVSELAPAGIRVIFTPASSEHVQYFDLDGLMLAAWSRGIHNGEHTLLKRTFDLAVASACLLLSLPLWLLIALAIRLDSPGPALFSQQRVGKGGRLFRMYKFRSMQSDAPRYALSPQAASDCRITPLGRFLRRTSLDELPQLLNVLRGDMSMVGPRPEMPFLVERYSARQRQRLAVLPGITGLWQLSADRRFLIHDNIQYDLYYIRNHNFFMDVAILLHTLVFAMRGV